jgi:hypothetical protein
MVLGELDLEAEELDTARRALHEMVRERAGGDGVARLSNPVHIGIGTRR